MGLLQVRQLTEADELADGPGDSWPVLSEAYDTTGARQAGNDRHATPMATSKNNQTKPDSQGTRRCAAEPNAAKP